MMPMMAWREPAAHYDLNPTTNIDLTGFKL
jgi:hypothetical protein